MNPALWIAKTGLDAQQTRLTVISNNLANVNTTGFKRDTAVFEDLIYQNLRQVGGQTSEATTLPSGLALGTGVRVVATEKLHTQGSLSQTGKPLDVAIQGRGFFQILRPDGSISYTRDGSFQIDANGQMVTHPLVKQKSELNAQITAWLSLLGFTPSDRARLGLAEIRVANELDNFRRRNTQVVDVVEVSED